MQQKKYCPLSFNIDVPMSVREEPNDNSTSVNARFCHEDKCAWWIPASARTNAKCAVPAILSKLEDIRARSIR